MNSIAIPHVSNPQMSNCVNQRMEFRVFERLVDRDYSPRVMAVRWPTALTFDFSCPSCSLEISPSCDLVVVLESTLLTNPQSTPSDPSDPNISGPIDSRYD